MTSPFFVQSVFLKQSLRSQPSQSQCGWFQPSRVYVSSRGTGCQRHATTQAILDNERNGGISDSGSPSGLDVIDTPPFIEEKTELLNEQMSAYFAATDSTFQPKLAPLLGLGLRNFVAELNELTSALRRFVGLEPPQRYMPPDVLGLQLNNSAVETREKERQARQGRVNASAFVRFVYNVTCKVLDVLFDGRPVPRFWFLETVARMPYFAYSSCLHLYATLGWYRSPTLMNMHHAEELNEAYHLSVMESLGGDKAWVVRFFFFFILYFSSVLSIICFPRPTPASQTPYEYFSISQIVV